MALNLDSITLKAFIEIAENGTFSHAANTIGRTQSALSLQIKKLEQSLGCVLFNRTARRVKLTEAGEVFLSYAKRIMELQWEAYTRLQEPEIRGEIKFGTPEDFATHYLADVLAIFHQHHPQVLLSVKCDLTLNLLAGFERNEYDLILVKRDPERVKGGTRVWREPLVWVAGNNYQLEETLSLVLAPQPCIYRARALAALDMAKKSWRIAYTSPSLAGTLAAVKAGLGITVLPMHMLSAGMHPINREVELPELSDAEIALIKSTQLSKAGEKLAEHIINSLEAKNF